MGEDYGLAGSRFAKQRVGSDAVNAAEPWKGVQRTIVASLPAVRVLNTPMEPVDPSIIARLDDSSLEYGGTVALVLNSPEARNGQRRTSWRSSMSTGVLRMLVPTSLKSGA